MGITYDAKLWFGVTIDYALVIRLCRLADVFQFERRVRRHTQLRDAAVPLGGWIHSDNRPRRARRNVSCLYNDPHDQADAFLFKVYALAPTWTVPCRNGSTWSVIRFVARAASSVRCLMSGPREG